MKNKASGHCGRCGKSFSGMGQASRHCGRSGEGVRGTGQALAQSKVHSKCRLAGFGLWLPRNPQRNLGRNLPKMYVFNIPSRVMESPAKAWILQEECPTEISHRFEWSLARVMDVLIRAGHWATELPEMENFSCGSFHMNIWRPMSCVIANSRSPFPAPTGSRDMIATRELQHSSVARYTPSPGSLPSSDKWLHLPSSLTTFTSPCSSPTTFPTNASPSNNIIISRAPTSCQAFYYMSRVKD